MPAHGCPGNYREVFCRIKTTPEMNDVNEKPASTTRRNEMIATKLPRMSSNPPNPLGFFISLPFHFPFIFTLITQSILFTPTWMHAPVDRSFPSSMSLHRSLLPTHPHPQYISDTPSKPPQASGNTFLYQLSVALLCARQPVLL